MFAYFVTDVDTSKPLLFDKIQKFLDFCPDALSDKDKQKTWASLGKSIDDLRKEFQLMKELTANCGDLSCGFTHNDLLLENVIFNKQKEKISFIDYEYGGYNYLYFDIGNHFAEHAGVDEVDYTLYPDNSYIKQWLQIYFIEYARLRGDNFSMSDADIDRACNLVNFFALWAHIFSGIWALGQAEHSNVPFDYATHAKLRLEEYFDKKEKFTAFLKQ